MLTHALRNCFHTDWATAWLKQRLPRRPAVVSVNEDGNLILEWDSEITEPGLSWSPGFLYKQLLQSKPDVTAVRCCWHLCRHYDDNQETSRVLTIALAARLQIKIQDALWYWVDQHDVLVSVAPCRGKPIEVTTVKTKTVEKGIARFVIAPDAWLFTTLVQHLKTRAFIPQDQK